MNVAATCSWVRKGCELNKAIRTEITHEDVFIRPELDMVLSEEHAMLLTSPQSGASNAIPCELQIRVQPQYKIESLHCVCNVSKMEIFLGPQKEYLETIHGVLIVDPIDEDDKDPPFQTYRYDFEVQKSGVVELTLKLLTHFQEICIFGMLLKIAPNPNGITTLQAASINLENVEHMLKSSGQTLSPNAEKCKLFMEMYKSIKPAKSSDGPSQDLLEQMKQMFASQIRDATSSASQAQTHPSLAENRDLKTHIDLQLQQLEKRLNARIQAFETQQAAKLDSILKILEERLK